MIRSSGIDLEKQVAFCRESHKNNKIICRILLISINTGALVMTYG